MIRFAGCILLMVLLTACKGLTFGPYVSPRVTGQVVAADTGQPVAGARVMRGREGWANTLPPHGAELLMRPGPTCTGADGRFVLPSERVLTPVRWGGWDTVRLTVERAGFVRFQTNFPAASLAATNEPGGVPQLDAGRIRLERSPRRKPVIAN